MIHRTDFHCITIWVAHSSVCKIRLCLIFPNRHEKIKYIFAQEGFYLEGILNDINEQDTSFLDCEHKHMMKCGAPPGKFGVHVPYVYL